MLTEPQFYLRVLEELLKYNSLENDQQILYDSDDISEYMEKKFGIVNDNQDDSHETFEKNYAVIQQIELTIKGFVQAMGKKVGIDLKFMEQ